MKKMYYILFMLVLAFSESAFSQKIRLTIESPTIPVLVKKEINPTIKLNFIQRKHPTLAAFVWASSFTTFARKTLCLYSTKQMFFGFVALQ